MQDWDAALEDLNRLKDVIESNVSTRPSTMPSYISDSRVQGVRTVMIGTSLFT